MSDPYSEDWRLVQSSREMNFYTETMNGYYNNYYAQAPSPHPVPVMFTEPEISPSIFVRSGSELMNGGANSNSDKISTYLQEATTKLEVKKEKIDYDEEYDRKIRNVIDELNSDFDNLKEWLEGIFKPDNSFDSRSSGGEFGEFSDDSDDYEQVPEWYDQMLAKKTKETRTRLSDLSNVLCYSCASSREYLIRTEADHNTPFCKLNRPRHRSIHKPWINRWKFICNSRCKEDNPPPFHAHTQECQVVMLEQQFTNISRKTPNLVESEFPRFLMKVVTIVEEFINKYTPDAGSILEDGEVVEIGFEYPVWNWVSIRSNHKNEVMIVMSGKNVQNVTETMKDFFMAESRKHLKVVSIYCINNKWTTKKTGVPPQYICGRGDLIDKLGSVLVKYTARNLPWFNAPETKLLGKAICDYLDPTPDITVLDIGCGVGAISNMLAKRSDKVIGLTPLDVEVKAAEEISAFNKIHNASFILCKPNEVNLKIPALLKNCKSVAVLKQDSVFGKKDDVIRNLRNLPTLWRVIVHGTFKKEFQKQTCLLVRKDLHLGDPFLPIQGCIVDKSAKNVDEFDIVILFERKPKSYLGVSAPRVKYDCPAPPAQYTNSNSNLSDNHNRTRRSTSPKDNRAKNTSPKEPLNKPVIKKEPIMFYEDRVPRNEVTIKQEPMGLASPISDTAEDVFADDLQNAETPKRNPYAGKIAARDPSPALSSGRNSSTSEFGFVVKPHESFMNHSKDYKKKDRLDRPPREVRDTNDDLRDLLEKKKLLQREIDEDSYSHRHRKNRDRDRDSDRDRDWNYRHKSRRDDKHHSKPWRKRRSRSRTPTLSPLPVPTKHYRRKSPEVVLIEEEESWDTPPGSPVAPNNLDNKNLRKEKDFKEFKRDYKSDRNYRSNRDIYREKDYRKDRGREDYRRDKDYTRDRDSSREKDYRREKERRIVREIKTERESPKDRELSRERDFTREVRYIKEEIRDESQSSVEREVLKDIEIPKSKVVKSLSKSPSSSSSKDR